MDEGTARRLLSFYTRQECIRDPHNRAIRLLSPGSEAVTRRDTLGDSDWYRNEHVEGRRECGFDDVLTWSRAVPNGRVFLSLHRAWGERPFSQEERERLIGPSTDSLPPRLHGVLECLLKGCSERESAAQLGLSPRTVHKYVEQLYRHFEVRSRAELMALFAPPPVGRLHCQGFFKA